MRELEWLSGQTPITPSIFSKANGDLLTAAYSLVSGTSTDWTWKTVDGHPASLDLSPAEMRHQRCHDRAAHKVWTLTTTNSTVPALREAKAYLTIDGRHVTSQLSECLREAYTSQDLREYICGRYEWSDATCDDIDWDSHGQALTKLDSTM
jgi:hypothetical protein